MDELLLNALDLAGVKGAQYADIRLVNTTQERLVVRNGVVDTLSNDQSRRHISGVTDVSGNTASSLGLASNGCRHALRDDVKPRGGEPDSDVPFMAVSEHPQPFESSALPPSIDRMWMSKELSSPGQRTAVSTT